MEAWMPWYGNGVGRSRFPYIARIEDSYIKQPHSPHRDPPPPSCLLSSPILLSPIILTIT